MSTRYSDAAAKLQAKVQTYLKEQENVSSSDEDEPVDNSVLEGVLINYSNERGDNQLLQRTKLLLEETLNGKNVTCLICISSIRRLDAIWSCINCYSPFHLSCIQKWGNDSIAFITEERFVVFSGKVEWCCPKCRHSYTKDEIPRKYTCYCGKCDNPAFHPWVVPHSCGETCKRPLSTAGNCKHSCLLLCHPGKCPPCPQTINGPCYCGGQRRSVRCSSALWSCGKICNKLLTCNTHKCNKVCHEGDCGECNFTCIQSCLCGSTKVEKPCNEMGWQCSKICKKPYSCGFHKCEKVCHTGDCGTCPKSGFHSCPCGAEKKFVTCPDAIVDTCLGTCDKPRETCPHRCSEKCHKGQCPQCLEVILKSCNCGSSSRTLPCSRDFKCDIKCNRTRQCKKHTCGKKCCNGSCPPCDKTCDKPLQCGRHKCTMICHSGPCYPCPITSKVTCRCKVTFILVPCGREKTVKPPKCQIPCKLKYKCGHTSENQHICHFGECPPCKATCNKNYKNCQHKCKAKCHKGVAVVFQQVAKPATPCEIQGPKTKILDFDCPPCEALVSNKCFGEHEITEQVCHLSGRIDCGRECGQLLSCGNHRCSLPCHLLTADENYPHINKDCETCNRKCDVPRPENCKHRCSIQTCHLGPCPPCEIYERIKCHCGLTDYYIICKEFCTVTEEFLSCKQPCPKNLECGHRCKKICHAGPCDGQICTKKVKSYCACGNVKKEFQCIQVRSGEANVECEASCKNKLLAEISEKQEREERERREEEERNKRELEEFEKKFNKKRKQKDKKKIIIEEKHHWLQRNGILLTSVSVVVIAVYCIYLFYI